ncbi:hypothetical protein [Mycobacteroides abscessus]
MSELVDRAKASLEGTTPGPWQVVGYGNIQPETVGEYPPIGKIYGKGNQQFIIAARRLVPELIAEVERLEGRIDVMAEQCRSVWVHAEKVIQERDEALRALKREQESHRETAEIMRRTRERAERLQAEIDAMKKQASVSCCTLSYKEGFSQCLSCQGKLR